MRLLRYLRRQRSLIAENERLQADNARLREELATAWLVSWIRRPPKAAALPESALPRATPHPVHVARHARDTAQTEVHPRAVRRREPSK